MISNYTRPQLQIFNNIQEVDTTLADRFRALVIGPNYRLNRYGLDTLPAGVAFDAAGQAIVLKYSDNKVDIALPLTDVVDAGSLKVYAENAELDLGSFTGTTAQKFYLKSLTEPHIIYATAGVFSAGEEVISGASVLGLLADRSVQVGDIVVVTDGAVTRRRTVVALGSTGAPAPGEYDLITLDGPAVDVGALSDNETALVLSFRIPFNGTLLTADVSFVASTQTVTITAGADLPVDGRTGNAPLVTGIGSLFPSYRSLIPPAAGEDRILIESPSDITAELGKAALDNDLGFGTAEALKGSQGRGIYVLRTAGTTVEDFTEAFGKVESTDEVYSLAILTSDLAVMQAARDHAAAMSQPDVKNWRRIYVGTDSPGSYQVLGLKADGVTARKATVAGASDKLVTLQDNDLSLLTLGVLPGDIINVAGADYEIDSVISAIELTTTTTIVATGPDKVITITRADTVASQKEFINARARALGSELVAHIWVENGTRYIDDVPTVIPNRFLAANIAGLRSALLPQQGLTYTEIDTITAAPAMYLRYRKGDLNNIAANGTFIITQESSNGALFVRHQLTTETGKGSLYYEDNATQVLHAIDFDTKDALHGYIGKKNATLQTVSRIENDLVEILINASLTTNAEIGPRLIGYRDLKVALHPVLKDRIITSATITIPLPLNNIDVTWNAEVSL